MPSLKWTTSDKTKRGIGPYNFVSPLESGAYSSVWLARDLRNNGRNVAIKVQNQRELEHRPTARFLPDGEVDMITFWDKANQELDILKRLIGCHGSVELLEVVEYAEGRLVVLEYLPFGSLHWNAGHNIYSVTGGSVESLPPRQPEDDLLVLSDQGIRRFLSQMLMALKGIHSRGIVHKDLKPDHCRLYQKWTSEDVRWIPCEAGPIDPFFSMNAEAPVHSENHPITTTNMVEADRNGLWESGVVPFEDENDILKFVKEKCGEARSLVNDNSGSGAIVLLDFNTAVYAPDGQIWDAEGTQCFAPPEALMRPNPQERKFDGHKRDVWCVGVCGYLAATGTLPFWDPNPFKMQCMTLTQSIEWNHPGFKGLSETTLMSIKGMLEKDPVQRLSVEVALELLLSTVGAPGAQACYC